MDDRRFDWLTKGVAQGQSRRSLLKAFLGLGAGAALGAHVAGDADAARRGYPGPTLPQKTPTALPCPPGSMQCGSTCCAGWCFNGTSCCPSPREYCAENNTCCPAGEKCCVNGYCYNPSQGTCCQDSDCPDNGKCCNQTCLVAPGACCSDFDCPSGDVCTQNNTCCHPVCEADRCGSDSCGGTCPCPSGYDCLQNGTCAIPCAGGSVYCEEQACGTCMVEAGGSTGYCAGNDRGSACDQTGDCPAGQFCTLLDPPNHCVTACTT